jgi:hypothetical protein
MPPGPTVRAAYLVPADIGAGLDVSDAFGSALRVARTWYLERLQGLTFRLDDQVRMLTTPHPAAFYQSNRLEMEESWWVFWNGLHDGLQLLDARLDDPETIWVFLLDAAAPLPDGHGAGAVESAVLLDRGNLRNLISEHPCPSVGAIAHELGHAFGLPHPPGCDDHPFDPECGSVMGGGFRAFPDTFIRAQDAAQLMGSRFFARPR